MIHIKNLHKSYSTKQGHIDALKDVSLSINKGEIFGIIGESGAGKSTLIRCINLLEKPTSGTVQINDKEITTLHTSALRKERQKIGMIFQHFNLLASKTVFQNVALPMLIAGKTQTEITEKVSSLLELVGLKERAHYYPAQLSGGQKQRVAIARALANDPYLLLCDEATSALDPHTKHSILQLLKDVNQKLGLTILLITHEMHVIKTVCDRVAVLEDGALIEQASILELFTAPKHKTTRRLIESTLKTELPKEIQQILHIEKSKGKIPILRIAFLGEATAAPLISEAIKKFDICLNILQASIDLIHGEIIGIMLVEIIGNDDIIESSIAFLNNKGLKVEVIGYVARDDNNAH